MIRIYGLGLGTLENINSETKPLEFVYAHGWLEESNGYDLIGMKPDDLSEFKKRKDGIYECEFWDNDSDRRTHSYIYWWHDETGRQHGLVCHRSDSRANEYAKEMYEMKARLL